MRLRKNKKNKLSANSSERGFDLEQPPLPRMLQLGEEVVIFEGLKRARKGLDNTTGLQRQDRLLVPQLPGTAINVNWCNYHKAPVSGRHLIDPFSRSAEFAKTFRTHNILVAMLDLDPTTMESLWAEDRDQFSPTDTGRLQCRTPQAEHDLLLRRRVARGLKLELTTTAGVYLSKAESEDANPLTFSQFLPYGWQLLNEQPPAASSIYLPDSVEEDGLLDKIRAKFIQDDQGFSNEGLEPLVGGIPDRPLVGV